ncbi:uncharacterized protein LOC133646735 [Entelurus aequoreus]|uniref:uncharacterized protein LOC133646735 n=1 Tax=Entelurus aequoreus TaxID=161455 RepID=UPI002B1D4C94|nr:uncharacterized protein LOC133646735 [Entelurus aequoreus]
MYVHAYTLYSAVRPFGCNFILGSHDKDDDPQLYRVDPSGVSYGYWGCAIGKAKQATKTEIEKLQVTVLPQGVRALQEDQENRGAGCGRQGPEVGRQGPEVGRLVEILPAGVAGCKAIGIRCKDGVVFGLEKLVLSKLYEEGSNKRILNIDRHVGMAVAGLLADAHSLAEVAREEASNFKSNYGHNIPLKHLSERVAMYVHAYTLYSAVRPFGCNFILGSHDKDDDPQLYRVDPSGVSYGYWGCAIGKAKQATKTEIEKLQVLPQGVRALQEDQENRGAGCGRQGPEVGRQGPEVGRLVEILPAGVAGCKGPALPQESSAAGLRERQQGSGQRPRQKPRHPAGGEQPAAVLSQVRQDLRLHQARAHRLQDQASGGVQEEPGGAGRVGAQTRQGRPRPSRRWTRCHSCRASWGS